MFNSAAGRESSRAGETDESECVEEVEEQGKCVRDDVLTASSVSCKERQAQNQALYDIGLDSSDQRVEGSWWAPRRRCLSNTYSPS